MNLRERVSRRSLSPQGSKKKIQKTANPKPTSFSQSASTTVCDYEALRLRRIEENKQRMQSLGIFSLSAQVSSSTKQTIVRPNKKRKSPIYQPRRRSDRLKHVAGKNYLKPEGSLKKMGITVAVGWKDEVYTKEDEKLLGDCKTQWTLDFDGVGEDGELLYDHVNGRACHQCRFKTRRQHTHCNKCRSPQGTICGDCLYTRYGENVLETAQNPKWLCPVCRGICNCSRCRRDEGWLPVTFPYAKVIELGFKSVAHYLILTQRAKNK